MAVGEEYKRVRLRVTTHTFLLNLPIMFLQVTYVHDIISPGRWCLSLSNLFIPVGLCHFSSLLFYIYSLLCTVININLIPVHILLPADAKTQYPKRNIVNQI